MVREAKAMKLHLQGIIKAVLSRKKDTDRDNFIGRVESTLQESGGRELNMVQACGSQVKGIPTLESGKTETFKDQEFTILEADKDTKVNSFRF